MTKAKTLKILAVTFALGAAIAVTASCGEKADTTPKDYVLVGNKICLSDGTTEAELDNQYVTIGGNVYYVVENEVVTGIRVIDGVICDFGEDGKLTNGRIYDFEFVRIGDGTYYAIQNRVAVNPCAIDGRQFEFDKNGKIISAPEGKVTIQGRTYFFRNKNIVVNHAEFIVASEDIIVNGVCLTKKGDKYLVRYDEDGVMIANVANNEIVTVDGNDYYMVKGKVYSDGGFLFIDEVDPSDGAKTIKKIYHFAKDSGIMDKNTVIDGYYLGADGAVTNPTPDIKVLFTDNADTYLIIGDRAVIARKLEGTISVPDVALGFKNDGISPANDVLVEITDAEYTFTEKTDSNGKFSFGYVPDEVCKLRITKTDYIPVTLSIEKGSHEDITAIIDRDMNITLSGVISEADILGYGKVGNIANAQLTLTRTSSTIGCVSGMSTDADGNYAFTGLTPGIYELDVVKDGYYPLKQILTITPAAAPALSNVKLEMVTVHDKYSEQFPDGIATGVFTDKETGKGIAGLTIYVIEHYNDLSQTEIPFTITENGEEKVVSSCETDENGAYEIKLPQGYYTLLVVDKRAGAEGKRYAMSRHYVKIFSLEWSFTQNFVLEK